MIQTEIRKRRIRTPKGQGKITNKQARDAVRKVRAMKSLEGGGFVYNENTEKLVRHGEIFPYCIGR